jgi:hypothetical protein
MISDYLSVKNKYYLSGFDWVMGVIDLIMKRTTCAGNASQVVFMLDAPPDEAAFCDALRRFLREFPIVGGSVSRHYTLTPYWKMPKGGVEPPVPLTVTRLDGESAGKGLLDALTAFINTPFSNKHEHLAFHLVYGKNEQCLAVTFDHRLFDARGAESFVSLFQQFLSGDDKTRIAEKVRLTQGFDLSGWKQKFLAGQTVNRRIVTLTKDQVRAVPISMNGKRPGFRYRIVSFDREEAEKIVGRAYGEAGYLMIMPYLFSRVAESMHRLFEGRGVKTGAYVVPVSTDLRRAKDIRDELFFNHTSMFFFQVKPEDALDRKKLLAGIKEQLYQQIQVKFPEKLMAASSLMRIAPLPLLNLTFHLPLQGKIASYCFSHVSKDSLASSEIMGTRITNVFHMPRTPVPPGIGVFFNSYRGRLNGTISWLDGQFTEEEMVQVEQDLKCSL